MQQGLLPLFPLPLVLLPRAPLPLHIFEERYKEMMADVLGAGSEFGVVLARSNGILNAGCTARVDKVLKRYPDGRLDILTTGMRRFKVVSLNDDKTYLRGAVEYFEDDPAEPAPAELIERARAACRPLWELESTDEPALQPDDPNASFLLAQIVEDLDFRQHFLRLRSEAERLKQLAAFCAGYVPRRKMLADLKRVQPLNGHGRIPPVADRSS